LTAQSSTALDVWVRLLRSHAAITRTFNRDLIAQHGLTVNDYEVLLLLSRAEDCQMRRVDLAEEVLLTASGITRLLDGLQRAGYVEKGTCASDARVTYAVLTDVGHAKVAEASASHLDAVRALFEERFSPEELRTLSELLARLPGGGPDSESCTVPDREVLRGASGPTS
jgi:DNA-binding MarR family transcriptional regulator